MNANGKLNLNLIISGGNGTNMVTRRIHMQHPDLDKAHVKGNNASFGCDISIIFVIFGYNVVTFTKVTIL